MKERKISEINEQELQGKASKMISSPILNALLIGFLIGIVVYSVAVNSVGLVTLIPLYLAYKLINKPKAPREKAAEDGSPKGDLT